MNLYRKDRLLGSWILSGVEGNQGQSTTTISLGCQSRSRIFDFEIINLTARGRGSCGGCCYNEPEATKGSAAAQLTAAAAGRELIQINPRVICLFVRSRLYTLTFTANSEKNSFGSVFWLIVTTFLRPEIQILFVCTCQENWKSPSWILVLIKMIWYCCIFLAPCTRTTPLLCAPYL